MVVTKRQSSDTDLRKIKQLLPIYFFQLMIYFLNVINMWSMRILRLSTG